MMQVHYNLIHPAHPDRSRAVLRVAARRAIGLTPLDTMLMPAPVELPCPRASTRRLCSRDRAIADETRKYGRGRRSDPFGLLFLCGKTLADYPPNVGEGYDVRTSCTKAVKRPTADLRRRRAHAPARCRHPDRARTPARPRRDAPAHPALALPLAGRLLPRDSRSTPRPATRSASPAASTTPRRAADRGREATPAPLRGLGRRHDRRDVPRPAPGSDAG